MPHSGQEKHHMSISPKQLAANRATGTVVTAEDHRSKTLFVEPCVEELAPAGHAEMSLLEAEPIPLTRTAAATSEQNGFEFSFSQLSVLVPADKDSPAPRTPGSDKPASATRSPVWSRSRTPSPLPLHESDSLTKEPRQ